jgi:hypothetical protein
VQLGAACFIWTGAREKKKKKKKKGKSSQSSLQQDPQGMDDVGRKENEW